MITLVFRNDKRRQIKRTEPRQSGTILHETSGHILDPRTSLLKLCRHVMRVVVDNTGLGRCDQAVLACELLEAM
jgi:hypothetical protein